MKKIVPVVIVVGLVVAGLWVYEGWWVKGEGTRGGIKVSGNIEVTEIELSFRLAGWVNERKVSEGARIKEGDVVAEMDGTELAQNVELRKAEVAAADAVVREMEAGSRPEEIARAESAMAKAKALVEQLETGSRPEEKAAAEATYKAAAVETGRLRVDNERISKLEENGAATKQEADTARAAFEAASEREREAAERLKLVQEGPRKEEIEQAKGSAGEAQATLALAKKGPRQEDIDRAKAEREQARRGLEIAQTRLGWMTLKSPVTGVVLSQNVESGEYVSAGTPVVTVADLTKVWLRAYVNEKDLGKVREGQKVEVTTDTYPGKAYAGTISFISQEAEFTPKSVQTQEERVKLVYRIKIDIDNTALELRPGMPADGRIKVGE